MSLTETLTQTQSGTRMAGNNEDELDDLGLIMKLDSRRRRVGILKPSNAASVPVTAKFCGQTEAVAGLALLSASLVQTIPESILKRLYQLNSVIEKEASKLLPFFLYASLFVLGLQAVGIIFLFINSILPVGLWFLLTCGVVLGGLFCHTSSFGLSQVQTPPPTPSHSSASLSSMAMSS